LTEELILKLTFFQQMSHEVVPCKGEVPLLVLLLVTKHVEMGTAINHPSGGAHQYIFNRQCLALPLSLLKSKECAHVAR